MSPARTPRSHTDAMNAAVAQRLAMHSTLVARYMGCAACAVGQEIAARVPASPRIVGQNDQRRRVSRAELQRLHAIAG